MRTIIAAAVVCLSMTSAVLATDGEGRIRHATDIPEQPLDSALQVLAKEHNLQMIYSYEVVGERRTLGVQGELTFDEAMAQLLAGTDLTWKFLDEKTVTIGAVGAGDKSAAWVGESGVRVAQVDAKEAESQKADSSDADVGEQVQNAANDKVATTVNKEEGDAEREGIPEILVTGAKVLNTDIRRTENDIQPYVIFDRGELDNSGVASIEEFLKNELTMNMSTRSSAQYGNGSKSKINLRGLGTDETLVLIDGRRVPGTNEVGRQEQADISAIPLSAVERIEILPTTASGIYGGSATGGVVNIVLRRDYSGLESKVTYGNTFESDAASRRIDLSAGFNFGSGRTNLLLAGSYADSNPLYMQERNMAQRGRHHIRTNDPSFFTSASAPPLGALPNICSATEFFPGFAVCNSNPLVLDTGESLGSPITSVPANYFGASTDAGAALVTNAGTYDLDLSNSAQSSGGQLQSLFGNPELKSLIVTLRHEFMPTIRGFLELYGAENTAALLSSAAENFRTFAIPGDASNNPFQQTVQITIPGVGLDRLSQAKSADRRVVGGVIFKLPGEWQASADFTWGRSTNSYREPGNISESARAEIAAGSVDVLRDLNQFPISIQIDPFPSNAVHPSDLTTKNATVRFAGALPWSLAGGYPSVASLIERRTEHLSDVIASSGSEFLFPSRSLSANSLYLETLFPLASKHDRLSAIELLDLQVALRYDDYKVTGAPDQIPLDISSSITRVISNGSSIDPTIGLRLRPIEHLTFRANFGTGYRPPAVSEITPRPPGLANFSRFTDPARGGESLGVITRVTGGNPNLRAEESRSWSGGFIFTPTFSPGLRVAADWSRIEKIDNITAFVPLGTQQQFEDFLRFAPERFTRGDPSGGFDAGPIIGLDQTAINIAKMRVETVDLALDYAWNASVHGAFEASIDATRLLSLETQSAPAEPIVENAGVLGSGTALEGGVKWKANGTLRWRNRRWILGWRTRFFDSYFFDAAHTVNFAQGAASVPSQTYHDVFGNYQFTQGQRFLAASMLTSAEFQFGINNVFNKAPPIDVGYFGAGYYSVLGDPRLANYYVALRINLGAE